MSKDKDIKIVVLEEDEYNRLMLDSRLVNVMLESADKLRNEFYNGEIFSDAISGIDVYENTMKDLTDELIRFKKSFIYKLWKAIVELTKW